MIATVSEEGSCRAFNLATVQMSSEQITTYDRMDGPINKITAGVSLAAASEKNSR